MFNSRYLAENIKKYRKAKNLSQSELADSLGVSPQSVSKWECGICVPDVENLCLISHLLNVSLDILLEHCAQQKKTMIGIDGGGTKTEFILFNEDGIILDRVKLSACNPNTVGCDGCIDVLTKGINLMLGSNPNVTGIYIGAAGFLLGNNLPRIQSELKKNYPHFKLRCSTDMLNIAASAVGDENCIAVICGTGSSVLINNGGNLTRLSGYGYRLSQSGSGYDIGRDAVYASLSDMDGVGEHTLLTDLIKAKLGDSVSDIIDKVYKNDASYTASLAEFVFDAYSRQDSAAQRIVNENAKGIADIINTAHKKFPHIKKVVLSGGIIANNPVFLHLVKQMLSPSLIPVIPEAPQAIGACMLCAKLCNVETPLLMQKLTSQYLEKR